MLMTAQTGAKIPRRAAKGGAKDRQVVLICFPAAIYEKQEVFTSESTETLETTEEAISSKLCALGFKSL
jgi:hypothetical protein